MGNDIFKPRYISYLETMDKLFVSRKGENELLKTNLGIFRDGQWDDDFIYTKNLDEKDIAILENMVRNKILSIIMKENKDYNDEINNYYEKDNNINIINENRERDLYKLEKEVEEVKQRIIDDTRKDFVRGYDKNIRDNILKNKEHIINKKFDNLEDEYDKRIQKINKKYEQLIRINDNDKKNKINKLKTYFNQQIDLYNKIIEEYNDSVIKKIEDEIEKKRIKDERDIRIHEMEIINDNLDMMDNEDINLNDEYINVMTSII